MFGGKKIKTRKGKEITVLNPSAKGLKFATELKNDTKFTNSGDPKLDANGGAVGLSKEERAYRSGYLDSRKDSAKAYNYNKKKRR